MAEDALWAMRNVAPGGKAVIWAHNFHVSRDPICFFAGKTMGGALNRSVQSLNVVVGFAFDRGELRAEYYPPPDETPPRHSPGSLQVFQVSTGKAGSLEARLARVCQSARIVALRSDSEFWRRERLRQIGSGYHPAFEPQCYEAMVPSLSRERGNLWSACPCQFFLVPIVTMSTISRRPYVSERRHRAAEEKKIRVRQAAKALVARRGIDRVTVAQIATKATVSVPTVYAPCKPNQRYLNFPGIRRLGAMTASRR